MTVEEDIKMMMYKSKADMYATFALIFGVAFALVLIVLLSTNNKTIDRAIDGGCAHYDSKTGQLTWGSGE